MSYRFNIEGVKATGAELNNLDGQDTAAFTAFKLLSSTEIAILGDLTATTAELNIMDGSATTQATVTLAAGDGVVINDGDTMKQCLVSDFSTYINAVSASGNNTYSGTSTFTGDVVFGTDDVDADGNRIQPAAILEPILEHTTDDDRNWPVVTQKDLGYDADEIPVSGLLGKLAFTDIPSVVGVSNAVPGPNELSFSVSGTTLTITYQPPDGSPALETTLTLSLPSVP